MTARPFKPREYQLKALEFFAQHPRCNLWAGMGLGKTSVTLTHLSLCYEVLGETQPTLVLAPKRVAQSTWPEEAAKWQHLAGLEVVSITGTEAERKAALKRDAPVYTTNYDNIVWLREQFKGKPWPFRRVVADESTRLKGLRLSQQTSVKGKQFLRGQGGKRAKALGELAHTRVEEWINLTGTPAPNGLVDVWGQQWFIDAGARLGRSFTGFQDRYFGFARQQDATGGFKPGAQRILLPYAEDLIHAKLADCTLTIDPHDYFDLQKPIVNVIEVELPPAARSKYRDLEREMFTRLKGGEAVEAVNAAALTNKCLQLANGAVYVDAEEHGAGQWREVHDEKLAALESVIEEAAGSPVLVAYHFKPDLARLVRAFPQGRVLDDSPQTITDWNAGRVPVLFAHPQSAGHGLNLQDGGNIIVFFGQWWDLEQHDQIIERIGPVRQLQSGHDRPVYVHYIVARQTVDQVVMARRSSKRSVQDALLAYMKGDL